MSEHNVPAVRVLGWFRRDVEDRLQDAVGGPARLRVVVLLACVLGLVSADNSTVGAVAVQLERSLHIGNTQTGLLVAVSTAIGAAAALPVGALTDRVNRTRMLTGAIVVWSIAMAVSGAANSYLMLLITRLALGAVVATAGPAVASLTGDLFRASERGRIYGFILTGELVGTGVGFLVSGDIAAVLSWRYSFWTLAVPGLLLAGAIQKLLPEPARGGQSRLPPGAAQIRSADPIADDQPSLGEATGGEDDSAGTEGGPAEGKVEEEIEEEGVWPHQHLVLHTSPAGQPLWWAVRYVLSIRTNRVLILASALGYFFFAGLRTFAVELLRGRFSIGQAAASTLLVVVGAGAVVGVLTTGRLADRLIGHRHITARPVVAGISFLLAAVLFLPGLLTTSLLVAAPLFFLAAAAVGGENPPLDAARLDMMHHRLWGRAEAVRTALKSCFEAIAPLLFGYVSTLFVAPLTGTGHPAGSTASSGAGLDDTFLIMLVPLAAAGLLLLLRARSTYPRDVATAIASEHATAGTRPPTT
jgi:predicted MFS family arabinose efflux permease